MAKNMISNSTQSTKKDNAMTVKESSTMTLTVIDNPKTMTKNIQDVSDNKSSRIMLYGISATEIGGFNSRLLASYTPVKLMTIDIVKACLEAGYELVMSSAIDGPAYAAFSGILQKNKEIGAKTALVVPSKYDFGYTKDHKAKADMLIDRYGNHVNLAFGNKRDVFNASKADFAAAVAENFGRNGANYSSVMNTARRVLEFNTDLSVVFVKTDSSSYMESYIDNLKKTNRKMILVNIDKMTEGEVYISEVAGLSEELVNKLQEINNGHEIVGGSHKTKAKAVAACKIPEPEIVKAPEAIKAEEPEITQIEETKHVYKFKGIGKRLMLTDTAAKEFAEDNGLEIISRDGEKIQEETVLEETQEEGLNLFEQAGYDAGNCEF